MLATWVLYPRRRTGASKTMAGAGFRLGLEDSVLVLAEIVVVQVVLLGGAYLISGASPGAALVQAGVVVILFGVALKIYMNYNNGTTGWLGHQGSQ